jgi:hypothetical protein
MLYQTSMHNLTLGSWRSTGKVAKHFNASGFVLVRAALGPLHRQVVQAILDDAAQVLGHEIGLQAAFADDSLIML